MISKLEMKLDGKNQMRMEDRAKTSSSLGTLPLLPDIIINNNTKQRG